MQINYLTWLRNKVGVPEEQMSLPENVRTIADLLDLLEARGENYRTLFSARSVIFSSVNGKLCDHNYTICDNDEVSFFSAIVGG